MKILKYFVVLAGLLLVACSKDNYVAPSITLKGRIVYGGEPLNLEYSQVGMQLWDPGWGKLAPIDVTVSQEGTFSSLLFAGKYKLIIPKGQGPFMTKAQQGSSSDTLYVDLKDNQNIDIEVTPYYLVRNAKFANEAGVISSTFDLSKVITDANAKNIERVSLYINKTQFVAGSTNIAATNLTGANITNLTGIKMSVNVPTINPDQNYVYARVGLKIAGVEDMIFSPIQKIQYK